MKRALAILLATILCLGLLSACSPAGEQTTASTTPSATQPSTAATEPETTLAPLDHGSLAKRAADYLDMAYGIMNKPTPEDYIIPASINIDGKPVAISWTVEYTGDVSEGVELVTEGNIVTVDVNEESPDEVNYILKGTISADGETKEVSFVHLVPAADSGDLSTAEIMARLFALEAGQSLKGTYVLRGEIVSIPSAYSAEYKNITVNLKVTDEEHIVQCYRLAGGEELKEGDVITVMGALKRYNDTFEFDAGATYSKELSVEEMKQQLVIEELYSLEAGQSLKGTYVLRGEIVSIPSAYSTEYKNITVNLLVTDEDHIVQCYRLAGGEELQVGDVITVMGNLKRYNDTFEFDAGATYSKEMTLEQAKDALVVEQLYELEAGQSLKGLFTLTGKIVSIPSAYSAEYKNITVNLLVTDEEHIVQCYRLAGGEELKEGDVITVTGNLKRYNDTFEFDAGATYVKVEE